MRKNMFNDFYKGKKVLVLGHTGFKGAWLTQWLLNLGAEVVGVSSYIPSQPSLFETLKLSDKIKDYRKDILGLCDLNDIVEEEKPSCLFHLAAQPIVRTSYEDPKLTFDTNLGGTINVLEMMRQAPCIQTGIFITSDKCYENVEWEYGYRENDRLGGKDPYSASKACAEIAIRSYYESFFKGTEQQIASVRAGNVIGGGDWADHRIIPDCMRSWSEGEPAIIRSPNATRPWQHVLEPLSGYLWLGAQLNGDKQKALSGESFNFGPDVTDTQTVERLITDLKKIWGNPKVFIDPPQNAPHEAGLLKLCCDKAQAKIGWRSSLSYDETVEFTGAWYKSYYKNKNTFELTKKQIKTYCEKATNKGLKWARNPQTSQA